MAKVSTDKLCNAVTLDVMRPLQALDAGRLARTVTALVKALEEIRAAALQLVDLRE
jgi:hypothetical protein